MNILHVAAENGALAGGKVGGIGDVIAEAPAALAELGCDVAVVTPSHGFLHRLSGSRLVGAIPFTFRGYRHTADLYEIFTETSKGRVRNVLIDHPLLASRDPLTGEFRLYTHDPSDRPFQTDANRFVLFCCAAAAAMCNGSIGPVDCLHLHDWHAAPIAFLREYVPECGRLKTIRSVYTIHNLALQGIRPLRVNASSLEAWFPGVPYDWSEVADPRWHDCVNWMAAGIRLSDIVHTVSPTYAREIQRPDKKPVFYGGEGLEADLVRAADLNRLIGILNGCAYPGNADTPAIDFADMMSVFRSQIIEWSANRDLVPSAHFIAHARALEWRIRPLRPDILLTGVSRSVAQKMLLLKAEGSNGRSGLENILTELGDAGCCIFLGAGDPDYERFLIQASARHENFLYLNGYSDRCANALYATGDLFLMPSSFEPCGLSQMLAMRHGQPCVVHRVGGLKDTVEQGVTGFSFAGESLQEQVDHMAAAVKEAVSLKTSEPQKWHRIQNNAAAKRFPWKDTASQYIGKLYKDGGRRQRA